MNTLSKEDKIETLLLIIKHSGDCIHRGNVNPPCNLCPVVKKSVTCTSSGAFDEAKKQIREML